MLLTRCLLLPLAIATCMSSCKNNASADRPDVLAANVDSSVHPGDDFFSYANGGWIKRNPIPNAESSWGIASLVVEENARRLLEINEEAAKTTAPKGSASQMIGDFWAMAMDSARIEKQGLDPLKPLLARIDSSQTLPQLHNTMAELTMLGVPMLLMPYIGQDDRNSEKVAVKFWQDGLFLPEREYYLKQDSSRVNIRAQYLIYLEETLVRSGTAPAEAKKAAAEIMALETRIAKGHRSVAAIRDVYKNYNKLAVSYISRQYPSIGLEGMLRHWNLATDSIIIGQPEYLKSLDAELKQWPVAMWKQWLRFRLVDAYASALPDVYGLASFDLNKLLNGATERRPRWRRMIKLEERYMGELLGQLFVKKYFGEKAKARYTTMVEGIKTALKNRIENLAWMSDTTKQKAFVKLAAMKKKVGYPDKWRSYDGLQMGRNSLAENMMMGSRFSFAYEAAKLNKPVDRDEWAMTPQTYNAYYNPSNNEIVLPAGIFTVPGYVDEELDDAVVYGYGGASTIGHEITHGFDDQGREYDDKGNLAQWWTNSDAERFKARAQVMVNQFSNYVVIDTFKINGEATLGENIADLGGILLGWEAFQQTEQYKKGAPIAGLSPAKRYFMGYALGWLGHTRPEELRSGLLTDVHSPAKFRVNGPMACVNAWYQTFGVQPTHKLFIAPEKRVAIW